MSHLGAKVVSKARDVKEGGGLMGAMAAFVDLGIGEVEDMIDGRRVWKWGEGCWWG